VNQIDDGTKLQNLIEKAPASPEVMHCFDDRYRKGKDRGQ